MITIQEKQRKIVMSAIHHMARTGLSISNDIKGIFRDLLKLMGLDSDDLVNESRSPGLGFKSESIDSRTLLMDIPVFFLPLAANQHELLKNIKKTSAGAPRKDHNR